jgi:hypothetical protein
MDKWVVFCCGQRYAEEIAKVSEDQLSSWEGLQRVRPLFDPYRTASCSALDQAIAMEYSMGLENVTDPYHVGVIRTALNKHLPACYPNIHDEVVQSFKDVLALHGDGRPIHLVPGYVVHLFIFHMYADWKAVPAMNTTLRVVCRVSNRLLSVSLYVRFNKRVMMVI